MGGASGCVVNARRLNFDGRVDFRGLEEALGVGGRLTVHDDGSPDVAAVASRAEGHRVLVTKEVAVDVETLPSCVELIVEAGTGFNNVDVTKAAARGIAVCNVPGYSSDAVAQLVVTFILSMSIGLGEQQRALARDDRSAFDAGMVGLGRFSMEELGGKVLGLVGGTGAIGRRVAALAHALGMRVLVWSRAAASCDAWDAVALDVLLAESDFVSLHCPLTPDTQGLIDAAALAKMKPTARLINTARGALVVEHDLVDALRAGRLAGAAMDVQHPEPPSPDSPLYTLPHVYLTPHIGWKRVQTRQRLVDAVAQTVDAYLRGAPINLVTPPVEPRTT